MNYEDFENDFFEDDQDEMVQLKKKAEMEEKAAKETAKKVEENYNSIVLHQEKAIDWTVMPEKEKSRLKATLDFMINWYIENGEQYEKCALLHKVKLAADK
jgi:hypothetical protein